MKRAPHDNAPRQPPGDPGTVRAVRSVRSIGPRDPGYPVGMLVDLAAPMLFVRGELPWVVARRSVAIVGARAATFRGVRVAKDLAEGLTASGVLVISGGAIGIDAAAHAGAVQAGAPTVVVLGSSVEAPYPPRNGALFDEVLALGGALVSATPAGTPPLPGLFLQRNRFMALMSDAVVVVEAQARSGSLTTARAALAAGKRVCAVPGTPGADALLAEGCALVEHAGDVLAALDGRPRRFHPPEPPTGTAEAAALAALRGDPSAPITLEDVALLAGLPPVRAQAALAVLELEGLVHVTSTGAWSVVTSTPELAPRTQSP